MAISALESAQNRAYEAWNKAEHVTRMIASARIALERASSHVNPEDGRGDVADALADFAIAEKSISDVKWTFDQAVEAAKEAAK
ncbi:MAG TPA: hypothetical protein VNT29_04910 [Candidatus Limnocylindrales bacterium]|nr:hypothetical protein [Candidatus Limnocylindrales bacterium]